jgi:hypothetical protein
VLPSPCELVEGRTHFGMDTPLFAAEVSYQTIQQATTDSDKNPLRTEEDNHNPEPVWAQNSSNSQDYLDTVMPSDEAIIKAMNEFKRPWEDIHHRSYFLLEISCVKGKEFKLAVSRNNGQMVNSLPKHCVYAKGNMENVSETRPDQHL